MKIGDDNDYGGAENEMGWGGANGNGPFNVSHTDADWTGPIDLSTEDISSLAAGIRIFNQ